VIAYFESSAFLKLFLEEPGSESALRFWDIATETVTVRLTYAEARAATASAFRASRLDGRSFESAKRALEGFFDEVAVIEAGDRIVRVAGGLAERRGLRGYDSVHLAAAVLSAARGDLVFVTWDGRLAEAARWEGLRTAGV